MELYCEHFLLYTTFCFYGEFVQQSLKNRKTGFLFPGVSGWRSINDCWFAQKALRMTYINDCADE